MNNSTTPTYEEVEASILRDLGGLQNFNFTYREDYIWFGITERMHESMCLLYYTLRLPPQPMRRDRFKNCRPISIWEDRHIQWAHENEKFDYTIWRVANAILDVRMEWMRLDVEARLNRGESLEDMPYIAAGCYKKESE